MNETRFVDCSSSVSCRSLSVGVGVLAIDVLRAVTYDT